MAHLVQKNGHTEGSRKKATYKSAQPSNCEYSSAAYVPPPAPLRPQTKCLHQFESINNEIARNKNEMWCGLPSQPKNRPNMI